MNKDFFHVTEEDLINGDVISVYGFNVYVTHDDVSTVMDMKSSPGMPDHVTRVLAWRHYDEAAFRQIIDQVILEITGLPKGTLIDQALVEKAVDMDFPFFGVIMAIAIDKEIFSHPAEEGVFPENPRVGLC